MAELNNRIAVYAGTFDPITHGHLDIIARAVKLFDTLYIGVADHGSPKAVLFSTEDRVSMIRESTVGISGTIIVESFRGLLVEYAKNLGAKSIVRGLRAVSDYEYESQMAMTNRELSDEVETLFLMTSDHCSFISSSIVREVARHHGALLPFVPSCVAERLSALFR